MKEKEILINLIEYNIHIIEDKIKENNKFDESQYNSLKEEIRLINEDNSRLLQFDVGKVKALCTTDLEESDKRLIDFYKGILTVNNFKMGEFDQGQLRSVLAKINTLLLEYKEQTKNEFLEERKQIQKYEELKNKINKNSDLTAHEIEKIYNLLKHSDANIDDSIKIMKYIANQTIKKYEIFESELDNEHNDEQIEKTNINIEDIRKIFEAHNSNLELLNKKSQEELQQYGNLNNIEQIFNILEKYSINSVNPYANKIGRIFVYSNPKLIEKVFETCLKYNIACINENGKNIINFEQLLKTPSKFINRKRKWKRKGTEPYTGPETETEIGTQEDFIKNIEYFASEGLDISHIYEKNYSCFDLPHEHIKIGVKNFKLYGIPKEYYLKTLSAFQTRKQADSFDQFIELGHFDYVKDNLSRAILLPDAPMFFKIARANQLELKIPKVFETALPSDITYDSKIYLGINKINGAQQTRKYTPEFFNKSYFDKAIYASDNNNIVLSESDEIIKALNERFSSEEDEMVYIIAGIRISKLKVMRIYNTLKMSSLDGTLDSLMYAITRNSIITKEQYREIEKEITRFYNVVHPLEKRSLVR